MIISVYNLNHLVFVMETRCVFHSKFTALFECALCFKESCLETKSEVLESKFIHASNMAGRFY